MRICIPVLEDQGLGSLVCEHFGSAPAFMIVDSESGSCRAIRNDNQHHRHGMCQPLAALGAEQVDGVIVGGIGMGALLKLQAANVAVFRARHATVAETIAALKAGTLRPVTPEHACAQHGLHRG